MVSGPGTTQPPEAFVDVVIVCRPSDPALLAVSERLRQSGIACVHLDMTEEMEPRIVDLSARCFVVDLRIGGAAFNVIEWCHAATARPVLTITDYTDVRGRLRALELRVADHIVAPFATREAIARVEAILHDARGDELGFAGIVVDPDQRVAVQNGKPIDLTPRELAVLLVLMRNRDRVTSKQELLDAVWPGRTASTNAVEAVVSALRRKLQVGDSEIIHTVHRAGYALRAPPPRPQYRSV